MSLSTANLSAVLVTTSKLSPEQVARLRDEWRRAYSGAGHRVLVLDHLYQSKPWQTLSHHAPLPLPFRWGPNGAFYLLLALLAAYGLIVAALHWIAA